MSRGTALSLDREARPAAPGPVAGAPSAVVMGLAALAALLAALAATTGLGRAGWALGLGCGAVLGATLVRALSRAGRATLGPADLVTLSRAVLACAVAGLTVEALLGRPVIPAVLALTVPALVLDLVDGRVARRTGTVTPFGGRFDGEVDAFLILVLSVAVAPVAGWWVLALGLARYAFAVGGWLLPWLRGRLEYRYWRKVVTATVGVSLTVAVAGVLPRGVVVLVLLGSLALLAESFGRDVWWLWHRRPTPVRAELRRRHPVAAAAATVPAAALVWFALLAPTRPDRLDPAAFLRLPVEGVVVAALALVVAARAARPTGSTRSARSRRVLVAVVGTALGALTLLKVLDLAAFSVLDRPFDLVTDRGQLASGVGFVNDSLGPLAATGAVVAVVALTCGVVLGLPWAVARLTRLVARHPRASTRAVAVVATLWVVSAITGLQVTPGAPVAAADTGRFVAEKVRATAASLQDREEFARAIGVDDFGNAGTADLGELAGTDVLLVVVESYGRVALEGAESAPVRDLLDAGTERLRTAGYTARSAYLTSPTFGSNSWLAHATLQSGLLVDDQGRYDQLLDSRRTTLSSAFRRAGWRTVGVLPSTRGSWPEGQAFYGFDRIYGRSDLGYAGPKFGFSAMPDQYALAAFGRRELGSAQRDPVMAAIELTSSHGPWAPLPVTVDPGVLGDGSVFAGIRGTAVTAKELWSDRAGVPAAYRASIRYSLTSVLSFVEQYAHDDLVVVLVGDHQPSTAVSGSGASRDVPVTVVAHDPAVLAEISGWGWQEGLRPDERAPVWPMHGFRDRFLTAYSGGQAAVPQGTP